MILVGLPNGKLKKIILVALLNESKMNESNAELKPRMEGSKSPSYDG